MNSKSYLSSTIILIICCVGLLIVNHQLRSAMRRGTDAMDQATVIMQMQNAKIQSLEDQVWNQNHVSTKTDTIEFDNHKIKIGIQTIKSYIEIYLKDIKTGECYRASYDLSKKPKNGESI